jgi:CRP/FNR family transcriptional regulator, cyclic AMP receptor protein
MGEEGGAFWRSFPMFENFRGEALAGLAAIATRRRWPAGSVLFSRGDPGDYLIALASGRIKLSVGTAQGRELSLRHAEAGAVLGEMAVLDDEPRSADATAVIASDGFVIGKREFSRLLASHPDLAAGVIRYLCRRLRETTDQLESIALYELEPRLARFFLSTLRQIHGEDLPDEARLLVPLSQGEIAGILGASRPKVNRALIGLEETGAIGREGGIVTCDVARLMALADPDEV